MRAEEDIVEPTVNFLVSSVNDVRDAQQIGSLMFLPFGVVYFLSLINFITLEMSNLLIISAVVLLIDAFLFYVSTATFRREEILTRWK